MKKSLLIIVILTLTLLFTSCGVNLPTKEANEKDETEKPVSTASAAETDAVKPVETPPGTLRIPGLQDRYNPSDLPQNNTSFLLTDGRIIHAYGGTWFVQPGMDNDGRSNGHTGSENIWFVSDEPEAEPVLIKAFPSWYADGIQQWTIHSLIPGPQTAEGRFLYFCARVGYGRQDCLFRLNLETGEYTELDYLPYSVWTNGLLNRSADTLYFSARASRDPEDSRFYETNAYMLDLTSGEIRPFDSSLPVAAKEKAHMVGMSGDYLYYAKAREQSGDYMLYGFFRMNVSSRKEEEVAPILCADIDFAYCLGDYLIYNDDTANENVLVSVESGKEVLRLDDDIFEFGDEAFTISGSTLYCFEDGSLMSISLSDGEKKQLIAGNERDFLLMTKIGDWFWFMEEDDDGVYRVSETGRILPGSPVAELPDWQADRENDPKTEGDWQYREYPHCIKICGYTGGSTEATVPSELGSKPVTIVGLNLKDNTLLKKLVIPEGVLSLHGITGSENLKELQLPKSLQHLIYAGYDYTIHLPADAVIRYAGTVSEWQAVFDFSKAYHDGATASSRNEVEDVICSDGTWHRHGNFNRNNNLLKNPGFESGETAPWVIRDLTSLPGAATILQVDENAADSLSGTHQLHFWREAGKYLEFEAEQEPGALSEGTYRYQISVMGGDMDKTRIYAYVKINGIDRYTKYLETTTWQDWHTATLYFDLYENETVTVGIHVYVYNQAAGGGAWGMIDEASLIKAEK